MKSMYGKILGGDRPNSPVIRNKARMLLSPLGFGEVLEVSVRTTTERGQRWLCLGKTWPSLQQAYGIHEGVTEHSRAGGKVSTQKSLVFPTLVINRRQLNCEIYHLQQNKKRKNIQGYIWQKMSKTYILRAIKYYQEKVKGWANGEIYHRHKQGTKENQYFKMSILHKWIDIFISIWIKTQGKFVCGN